MKNNEINVYKTHVDKMERDVFYTTFGKDCRMELKNSLFNPKGSKPGKLGVLLQKFDQAGKQVAVITCYIDLPKALVIANDILSGRYAKLTASGSENGGFTTVFEEIGGSNRNGTIEARRFTIQKGKKWIISASSGPGKVTDKGGFTPDGNPTTKISVGVDDETLKEIGLMIQAEYSAMRTAQWIISADF